MIRKVTLLVSLVFIFLSTHSPAQNWSGILDPARAVDWTTAGAGTIPTNRTQCGSTIAPYSGSAATINNAFAACGANTYLLLGAGTFNLSSGIRLAKNNVTLRGAGPDQTHLNFTGFDSCGGKNGYICIIGAADFYPPFNSAHSATWKTGNFAQGTTVITLANVTGLTSGQTIVMDQDNDNASGDTGGVYDCTLPSCVISGGSGVDREQRYIGTVTNINGTQVTVDPPLYMPNWSASKNPVAYWPNAAYVSGVGLENVSVENTGAPGTFGITFYDARNSWQRNVRVVKAPTKQTLLFYSHHITIRDSYYFAQGGTPPCNADAYAVDMYYAAHNLVENNIGVRLEVQWMNETNSEGNVFSYNYSINNLFIDDCSHTTFMQAAGHDHGGGNNFSLWEGNEGNADWRENYYATAFFVTDFRNRWAGVEMNLTPTTTAEDGQTSPALITARARFNSMIGSVLGTTTYHTHYKMFATGVNTSNIEDCSHSTMTIGGIGCGNGDGTPPNDVNTVSSTMLWGNYSVCTGDANCNVARFKASEVTCATASGDNCTTKYGFFPNPTPATQTLPASFLYSSKPAWFGVIGRPTIPWPPIGPDVTGGDETARFNNGQSLYLTDAALAGHVNRIPARVCYEDIMGATYNDSWNSNTPLTFNADKCYSPPGDQPDPPTGLAADVN